MFPPPPYQPPTPPAQFNHSLVPAPPLHFAGTPQPQQPQQPTHYEPHGAPRLVTGPADDYIPTMEEILASIRRAPGYDPSL